MTDNTRRVAAPTWCNPAFASCVLHYRTALPFRISASATSAWSKIEVGATSTLTNEVGSTCTRCILQTDWSRAALRVKRPVSPVCRIAGERGSGGKAGPPWSHKEGESLMKPVRICMCQRDFRGFLARSAMIHPRDGDQPHQRDRVMQVLDASGLNSG